MSDAVEAQVSESQASVEGEQPDDSTQTDTSNAGQDSVKDGSEEELPENIREILSKNRQAVKEAEREQKRLKAQLDEFEKANMTELERAQAEANEYKSEAEKRARQLSVYQLAMDKGLTDQSDIALLEEVESDEAREKLAQRLADRNSAPNNPKPDLTQGASGKHTPPSNAEMFAQQLGDF